MLITDYVNKLKSDNEFFKFQIENKTKDVIHNLYKYYKLLPKEYVKKYIYHIKEDHKENPLATLYIESELGAPLRQIELIKQLENNGYTLKNKSVLDIGCSNGALLLACHDAGANKIVGVDIDENRINSAKMLIGDKKIDLLTLDIVQHDLPEEYISFDIILATDVLEHVSDVKQFFCKIKRHLSQHNDDSFAYVSVFNKFCFHNIISEPHYNVPGMILLDYADAKNLWYHVRSKLNSTLEYEVFHWHTFEEYAEFCDNWGLELLPLGDYSNIEHSDIFTEDFKNKIDQFNSELKERIDNLLAANEFKIKLKDRLTLYCDEFSEDHHNYNGSHDNALYLYLKYYMQPMLMIIKNKRGHNGITQV
ncbi:class I SAM-dependent methyltransferase [Desulfococcaceae bacterium HSG9]|nr:class I SAM-dependent methyltransferase [Desulfococcaceae bacterium HSG9]